MKTVTAKDYPALTDQQKLHVLQLPINQAALDVIRTGSARRRSDSEPLIALRLVGERALLALGNVAFRHYPSLCLHAPEELYEVVDPEYVFSTH